MLPWFRCSGKERNTPTSGARTLLNTTLGRALYSSSSAISRGVTSVLIIVASFVSDQPPTIMIGAIALATASASFYVPLSGFSRAQPASALRVQPIHASEETLWHAIRSARKSKQECLVDAENMEEIQDCQEGEFSLGTKNPIISPFTIASAAPVPAFDEIISVEECIVSAESRLEQQDCATRAKFASFSSPNPAAYPSEKRGFFAGLRDRFNRRRGAHGDFPSPWFPATIAGTVAVGRALARF